jgi:predicted transcriptional regulator
MDWKKIIEELSGAGVSQYAIAKELALTQATISRVATGDQKDMKWSDGQRLLQLHSKHFGAQPLRTEVA